MQLLHQVVRQVHEGTGSFLAETRFDFKAWNPREPSSECDPTIPLVSDEKKETNKTVPPRTRYFSPREVANIHSFPATFAFPEQTTKTQRFAPRELAQRRVHVAPLLEYLLNDTEDEQKEEVE